MSSCRGAPAGTAAIGVKMPEPRVASHVEQHHDRHGGAMRYASPVMLVTRKSRIQHARACVPPSWAARTLAVFGAEAFRWKVYHVLGHERRCVPHVR